jgi:glycolate oxidase iron-sulfur subunit
MAEQIGKLKAENIKSTQAPIVATANPGCMTQIQSALGEDYKVLHPVSILADYLRALN